MRAMGINSLLIAAEEYIALATKAAREKRESLPGGSELKWELLELESELRQAHEHLVHAQIATDRLRVEETQHRLLDEKTRHQQ